MERAVIQMDVRKERPPNFAGILKVFPQAAGPGILFAYGDAIYNPSDVQISTSLAAHEYRHLRQQNGEPAFWWERYLHDKEFRLAQEIEAHRDEYEQWCLDNPERKLRRLGLKGMAQRLSGPLYCHMLTYDKAKALIKVRA